YLSELPTKPSKRTNYDESVITALCHYDDERRLVSLTGQPNLNAIETLIAMNKALHLRLLPVQTAQWVFARWESKYWPIESNLAGAQIQIVQTLGNHLTKSEICL